MNKKLALVIIVILLSMGGGFAYLLSRGGQSDVSRNRSEQASSSNSSDITAPVDKPGSYIDYDEESLGQTTGTRILFFHAAWCPQCRQLEADIKGGAIPEGVTIFKVDYDTNQDLRKKYGVTLQTTLVRIDDNDDEIEKFVAYDDPTLDALVERLL